MKTTLFDVKSEPKTKPKKPNFSIPRIGPKVHPRACPDCHQTILTALVDGLCETMADPINLAPHGIQAALTLRRPIYRAPLTPDGLATELRSLWPGENQPKEALLPEHACGAPLLPGELMPVKPPNQQTATTNKPPY